MKNTIEVSNSIEHSDDFFLSLILMQFLSRQIFQFDDWRYIF